MDGDYHFEQGNLSAIKNMSRDDAELLLRLLRGALRDPPKSEAQRQELAQKIADVSPSAAKFIDKEATFAVSVVALIVAILSLLSQLRSEASSAAHDDQMLALAERLTELAEAGSDKFDALKTEVEKIGEAVTTIPPTLKQLLEEVQTSPRSENDAAEARTEKPLSKRRERRLRGKAKERGRKNGSPG